MFEADPGHYKTISILGTCCEGLAIVHLTKHVPSATLIVVKKFNMDKAKEESLLIQVRLHHPPSKMFLSNTFFFAARNNFDTPITTPEYHPISRSIC